MRWPWPWGLPALRQRAHAETVRAERKLYAGLAAQERATRELTTILAAMRDARPRGERPHA